MSTSVEPQVAVLRPSSWRDELLAEYESAQARLRRLLPASDEEPQEYL